MDNREDLTTAREIVQGLLKLGVEFQLIKRGELQYEYTGTGDPDMAAIQPLIQALTENREAVHNYMHEMAQVWEDMFRDVRPELGEKYGDSKLWRSLLQKAAYADVELWYNLRAFRMLTTVFKNNPKTGKLRLAPVIGKDWHELVPGWRSQQDYDTLKETHLAPFRDHLQRIIGEVIAEHELS